jgi:hypothetical protein
MLFNLQGCRVFGQGRMPAGIYLKEHGGVLVKIILY